MSRRECVTFGYYDLALRAEHQLIGFGVFQVSDSYFDIEQKRHAYIPLLSAKPGLTGRGYGKAIVSQLIQLAETIVRRSNGALSSSLYLDVYVANTRAIYCYKSQGFEIINETAPILDERENNQPYYVMSRELDLGDRDEP